VTISEPVTMLTDYLLATGSMVFGISLLRNSTRSSRIALLWPLGFFCGAAAAIVGGTFHGFATMQSAGTHTALWNITLVLIGISAGFMISAALCGPLKADAQNTRWLRAGAVLSVAGLLIQLGRVSFHPNFNHNDLYHCVQTVALYFLFRGARLTAFFD
jgi:hypothetical protein